MEIEKREKGKDIHQWTKRQAVEKYSSMYIHQE